MQPHGPYLLSGCGVLSCMLAFAMACELEHQGHQQVMLILIDGPSATPDIPVIEPYCYGLYQLCADAGTLLQGNTGSQSFAAFIKAVSAVLTAVEQANCRALPDSSSNDSSLPDDPSCYDEQIIQRLAVAYRPLQPGSAAAWDAQAAHIVRFGRYMSQLTAHYQPEYVYQGPAVLLLTEDAVGAAFLENARECCAGSLSFMYVPGIEHGEGLVSDAGREMTASLVMEAVAAVLQMI